VIYKNFIESHQTILQNKRIGLLCNSTSFSFFYRNYFFAVLAKKLKLTRVFVPEHGLFSELQDQMALDSTSIYNELLPAVDFVSLYGSAEESLKVKPEKLCDLDVLIIDLHDIGVRYYTFITSCYFLFEVISELKLGIKVIVFDHFNRNNRQVEGSEMQSEFASFIGLSGLLHKHGLSFGELCLFLTSELSYKIDIAIFTHNTGFDKPQLPINPSPNIPSLETIKIYSGQCLFEGTILSEGRGTTRPFEIVGAPFLTWKQISDISLVMNKITSKNKGLNAHLRPLKFIPVYHKFANELCYGFQLHATAHGFHALAFSLLLIREIANSAGDFDIWRKGKYEKNSNKTAIELLCGDALLLDFLNNKVSENQLFSYLNCCERNWIAAVQPFLLYKFPMKQISLL